MDETLTPIECQAPKCEQRATFHITNAEGRKVVQVLHFCDQHGKSYFTEKHSPDSSPQRIGPGKPFAIANCCGFDIDFLVCDELLDQPWGRHYLELVEIGGARRVGFATGSCEAAALDFTLKRYSASRPLTYHVMASLISTLGGRVQYVEIDKFFPSQQIYEAKLHIRQMNTDLAIDVRPSDAVVLAVTCDVPIVVSEKVLAIVSAR